MEKKSSDTRRFCRSLRASSGGEGERGLREERGEAFGDCAGLLRGGEPSLWDLGLFIFDNASPGAAAAIERLRHQTLERLGQQSQDMAQEHAAAESASRPAESSRSRSQAQ